MGGVVLDLRDATLSGQMTDVFVVAVMGGVEIKVPPGVRLESDGIALMGGVMTRMQPRGWDNDGDD